jgi:hypothetical protein
MQGLELRRGTHPIQNRTLLSERRRVFSRASADRGLPIIPKMERLIGPGLPVIDNRILPKIRLPGLTCDILKISCQPLYTNDDDVNNIPRVGTPQRQWDKMSDAERQEQLYRDRVRRYEDMAVPKDQWDKDTRDRFEDNENRGKPNE